MKLTIQCGIVKLTQIKQQILDKEYSNVQNLLELEKEGLDWLPIFNEVPLYSANRQQALRYKTFSLRNNLINVQKAKSFWFLKIPVYNVRGGIKVPIKPHRSFPENSKLCESKIVKRKHRKNVKYTAMLTFEFDTPQLRQPASVLSVDFGERFTATSVILQDRNVMKAKLHGKEIRGIRRHNAWLRKRLQEKGLTKVVNRIGNKEKRRVNDILHKISIEIIRLAESNNSCIIFGDLKGIRKATKGKGKRFNRIVSNMPYYRLGEIIKYKAEMKGIVVILTSEAYTSKTCHICGNFGKRKTQGNFVCNCCGEYNADLNGAINIGKNLERCLGYMPLHGASCEHALN